MVRDPVRWVDDPRAGSDLRRAMECAATAMAAPSDTSAELAALRAKIREPSATSGLKAKVGVLLLGGVLVFGGTTAIYQRGRQVPAAGPATSPALKASAPAPVPSPVVASREAMSDVAATPVPEASASSVAAASATRPARPPATAARVPSTVSSAGAATAATDELAQVALARSRVRTDPAAALRVLTDLDRTHPRGLMLEEREFLAMDALVRQGRREEAQARAKRFLRAYPKSPYADQVTKSTGLATP